MRSSWNSCGQIQSEHPSATSGLYYIKLPTSGKVLSAYCDMGSLFGAPAMLVYQSHAKPNEAKATESTGAVGSVSPTPSPSATALLKLSDADIAEYRASQRADGRAPMNDLVSRGVYDGTEIGHAWMHPGCALDFSATHGTASGSACLKATLTSSSSASYMTAGHTGWPTASWYAFSKYGFITGHANGRFYIGGQSNLGGMSSHTSHQPPYYCGTHPGTDACGKAATMEFWVQSK